MENTPPNQPPWLTTHYGSLCRPHNLHDLHNNNYLNITYKFNGEKRAVAEDHVVDYVDFIDNMKIDYEDLYTHILI